MVWIVIFILLSFLNSSCVLNHEKTFKSSDFLNLLAEKDVSFHSIPLESNPYLLKFSGAHSNKSTFKSNDIPFAIIECDSDHSTKNLILEDNNSSRIFRNKNLALIIRIDSGNNIVSNFEALKEPLSYKHTGVFIYPLGTCLFVATFIIAERLYSLRRGLTFPRKVEKALRSGEFPNKKWKSKSAAERIVHVAVTEKASQEALLAYSRLEISALEKGLFLLEVVVSAAPLIGLLGTATGLVQVFSSMPANGMSIGTEVFSEGIALALLTTIIGLAIAIPTLIGHSYLIRIVEKRAASLDWLTARLIDAVGRNKVLFNS